jgi:hypothetical protein
MSKKERMMKKFADAGKHSSLNKHTVGRQKELLKKWEESGVLDGLTEMVDTEKVKLFEPNLTQGVYVKTIPNEENDKNLNKMSDKQYWFCKIGPVNKSDLGYGADGPLRQAVEEKFIDMFGEQAEVCGSGWGLTQEMKTRLDIISLLPITNPELLSEIDELLSKKQMN